MGRDEQGVADNDRYHVVPRTLVFVLHEGQVLLIKGAPHKRLWAGKYNGLGGHVERGEDIFGAALREVREEAGLDVQDLRLAALVHVDAGSPDLGVLLFVFLAESLTMAVNASSEGSLEWHPVGRLPLSEMVEDLPVLLPRVLGNSALPFWVTYTYDEDDHLHVHFADAGQPANRVG